MPVRSPWRRTTFATTLAFRPASPAAEHPRSSGPGLQLPSHKSGQRGVVRTVRRATEAALAVASSPLVTQTTVCVTLGFVTPTKQGRAIGYTRVSTTDQAERGASLAAQEAAIRAECERRGWTLIHVFTDAGKSGASMNKRSALASALQRLDAGEADTLVVAKLDRLSRSLVDLASLMERARHAGWGLAILDTDVDTTTASGELVANVMGSVAQWERRIIGERTKAGLAAKRAEGVVLGRPRTVSSPVRRRIARLRDSGLSWRAIAERLNADGVPTGQGGAHWHANTARRIYEAR